MESGATDSIHVEQYDWEQSTKRARTDTLEDALAVPSTTGCDAVEQAKPKVECTICYEEISAVCGLPCACKNTYCLQCWDRALAASFKATGMPRCPTCRARVQVDFDAERGLIFSCPDESDQFDPNKLYRQAQDAQCLLLRQYGADSRALQCLGAVYEGAHSAKRQSPSCVCGGKLRRVGLHERLELLLERLLPTNVDEVSRQRCLDNMASSVEVGVSPIRCDLCWCHVGSVTGGRPRGQSASGMWTCTNFEQTILHSAAYDICDECFNAEVHGSALPRAQQMRKGGVRTQSAPR